MASIKYFDLSEAIFGNKIRKVDIGELSKRTGIPMATLYAWRKNPSSIPLKGFARIARVTKMSDEEVTSIIKKV